MERLTYVTEDGTVLFSPDGKDAVTITDISAMGDTEYLEQIADTLANREIAAMFYERKYNEVCNELKEYENTGLTPEQVRELAEKQKPMKVEKLKSAQYPYRCHTDASGQQWISTCGYLLEIGYKHCISCGQRLEYEKEEVK